MDTTNGHLKKTEDDFWTSEIGHDLIEETAELKDAVESAVNDTSLPEKVESLRVAIDEISSEVQGWKSRYKDGYLESLDTLVKHVEEIESEWDVLAESLQSQKEKVETMLSSFPGVIETSTLKALTLRVSHLEQLLSEVVEDSRSKASSDRSKKQLAVSYAALGVTIVLWGVWLSFAFFK